MQPLVAILGIVAYFMIGGIACTVVGKILYEAEGIEYSDDEATMALGCGIIFVWPVGLLGLIAYGVGKRIYENMEPQVKEAILGEKDSDKDSL